MSHLSEYVKNLPSDIPVTYMYIRYTVAVISKFINLTWLDAIVLL